LKGLTFMNTASTQLNIAKICFDSHSIGIISIASDSKAKYRLSSVLKTAIHRFFCSIKNDADYRTFTDCLFTIVLINDLNESTIKKSGEIGEKLGEIGCIRCGIFTDTRELDDPELEITDYTEGYFFGITNNFNAIILACGEYGCPESITAIDSVMFLLEHSDDTDNRDKLLNCIRSGGLSYYKHLSYTDEYDIQHLLNYAMFEMLFVCPYFVAKSIFCNVQHGSEFVIKKVHDTCVDNSALGDNLVTLSTIYDHIDTGTDATVVFTERKDYEPYDTHLHFLISGFNGKNYMLDSEGIKEYPKASTKRLEYRIKTTLDYPFFLKCKRDRYYYLKNKNSDEQYI